MKLNCVYKRVACKNGSEKKFAILVALNRRFECLAEEKMGEQTKFHIKFPKIFINLKHISNVV